MKILVVADIHGKFRALRKIMDDVAAEKFDLLIAPGDFTDMLDRTPDFTQMEIADLVVQKLVAPDRDVLCVPGNHDPFEIVDIFNDYGINLHHKKKKVKGITFVGFGGAETPFNTLFEPSDEEIDEALSGAVKDVKGDWVLVTHAPPRDTVLDVVKPRKHVGSGAVRKIITVKKPLLAISAHIHENSGTDRIGQTTLFYPGPAYKGFYGVVNIDKRKIRCEIKRAV